MSDATLTKVCNTCNVEKPVTEFHKNVDRNDGYVNQCKICKRDQYRQEVSTPEGAATNAWTRIRSRVNHHPVYATVEIRMTKDEFMAWAIPEYAKWFRDHPDETPSVDRKDSTGHYEISNIQIIAYLSNCAKTSRAVNVHLPPEHKQCGKCKQAIPFAKFKKVKPGATGTFGLYGWCIDCTRAYDRGRQERRRQSQSE